MNARDEIESIKQLKYRYFRYIDQKKLDEIEELMLPDCDAIYHGGRYGAKGRDGIMQFLRASIGQRHLLTMHHGHHPEITLISETEATGIWYLHDVVIDPIEKTRLEGNGFYDDLYRKVDGEWKIARTGYHRTFDLKQPLGEVLELFDGFAAGEF